MKLRTKTDAVGMAGRHPVFRSGRHFVRRRFGSTLFNRVLSAYSTPLTESPLSKISEERDSTTMLEEQEELLNNTKATDQCFVIFLPSSGGEKPRQFNELASGMVLNNETTTARSAKGEEGDRPF